LTSPAGACDKVDVHLQHEQKFTWCLSKVRGNPRPMTGSSSDSTDRTAACASDGISSASSADTPRSCKQAWVMVLSSAGVECANVSLTASRVVIVTVSFVATVLRPPNLPSCEASNGNETHDHTPAVGSKGPFTPYSCPSASIYPAVELKVCSRRECTHASKGKMVWCARTSSTSCARFDEP
jgi:hypothetical protein